MTNEQMTGTVNCHVAFKKYPVSFHYFATFIAADADASMLVWPSLQILLNFSQTFIRIFNIIALQGVTFHITDWMYAPKPDCF